MSLLREDVLTLSAAARRFPGHRANTRMNPSAIWRWIITGAKSLDGPSSSAFSFATSFVVPCSAALSVPETVRIQMPSTFSIKSRIWGTTGLYSGCRLSQCSRFVVAISDGRIAWPIGKPLGERGRSLIVFGALANAVRRESNQAVCQLWGVTPQTVSKWRKLLGVGATTDGTSKLRSDYCHEPVMDEARKKAWAKAKDPARREKIAAAKRGRWRPWSVIKKLIKAKTGTKDR